MANVETASKEKLMIFQTILSSPGMNEKCKISLVISRQNILLLSRLIEAGLLTEKNHLEDEIIRAMAENSATEFQEIHEEILKKAALTEFYDKIKML